MKYCTKCVYPETKPDIWFNDQGVCSACLAFEERDKVDWKNREAQFEALCAAYRGAGDYDCIVPVSGGKDSTAQVVRCMDYGLRVLAVTATTDNLSTLGRRNLDNISKLGCDHIEVSVNKPLRNQIAAHTLRTIGDISWPEHITIFTVPVRVAVKLGVKLIVWGENPQNEYGGPKEAQKVFHLTQRWLQEYGGLNGLRVTDLIEQGLATHRDMVQYTYPTQDQLLKAEIVGVFLGQYFAWDGFENAKLATKYGFERCLHPVEGTGYDYENLDNYQTGIHDYFKYLKFGFGRCTDIANNHIRRQRISREEAIDQIRFYDGQFPNTYLGKPLEEILKPLGVEVEEYLHICNFWTNKKLFRLGKSKRPYPLFEVK